MVSGLGLDVSFVILDEQIKASKKEEIYAESNKIEPNLYSSSFVSSKLMVHNILICYCGALLNAKARCKAKYH